MSSFESTIEQIASKLIKEYLSVDDLIQRSRNFIYSELKMVKYTNITLEKERNIFNQIINGVENDQIREELIRVKQVFFSCIKEQMILFQKILARHMEFVDVIQLENPQQLKSKAIRLLNKQKDSLLHYLLSSNEDDSGRNSQKNKSLISLKELMSCSFSFQSRSKRSFRTIPDCNSDDEDDITSNYQKKNYVL